MRIPFVKSPVDGGLRSLTSVLLDISEAGMHVPGEIAGEAARYIEELERRLCSDERTSGRLMVGSEYHQLMEQTLDELHNDESPQYELVKRIRAIVHDKIDLHDAHVYRLEQQIVMEQQINRDLIEACNDYDKVLDIFRRSLEDKRGTPMVDHLLKRIDDVYGKRIKDHTRSHLCAFQAAPEPQDTPKK